MLRSLAGSLGAEGGRWLRACAVFPALSWPVTCHLGQHLTDDSGRPLFTEERLLRLVRLPWFRHGKMPDWLRLELIDAMDPGERAEVRRSLRELLAEALRASGAGGQPEVAQQPAWRRDDRALSRLLGRQGRPLRDYLFLSFLRGRRPSRLALAAPRWLRTLIRDVDRWSVLASTLLALAGTLAIAVWYRVTSLPAVAPAPLADWLRVLPMPASYRLPEASIVAACLLLAVLVFAFYGLRRTSPSPGASEVGVPGLIARIAERRLAVLGPLVATAWVGAFIVVDFGGGLPPSRWLGAHLVALLTLGFYVYIELGFSRAYRTRLEELEAGIEAGTSARLVHGIAAFLRGRAGTDLKRRLLRLLRARLTEPPAGLVSALHELRHAGSLEPRIRSLLQNVVAELEERARRRIDTGEGT